MKQIIAIVFVGVIVPTSMCIEHQCKCQGELFHSNDPKTASDKTILFSQAVDPFHGEAKFDDCSQISFDSCEKLCTETWEHWKDSMKTTSGKKIEAFEDIIEYGKQSMKLGDLSCFYAKRFTSISISNAYWGIFYFLSACNSKPEILYTGIYFPEALCCNLQGFYYHC